MHLSISHVRTFTSYVYVQKQLCCMFVCGAREFTFFHSLIDGVGHESASSHHTVTYAHTSTSTSCRDYKSHCVCVCVCLCVCLLLQWKQTVGKILRKQLNINNATVVPKFLYGNEDWTLKEWDLQIKIVTILTREKSEDIKYELQILSIVDAVWNYRKQCVETWLEHKYKNSKTGLSVQRKRGRKDLGWPRKRRTF
jgi:hypothetical protein